MFPIIYVSICIEIKEQERDIDFFLHRDRKKERTLVYFISMGVSDSFSKQISQLCEHKKIFH